MGLRPFVSYFIGQFRAAFLIRIVLVSIGSIADALMPVFVGLVVGMLATTIPVICLPRTARPSSG